MIFPNRSNPNLLKRLTGPSKVWIAALVAGMAAFSFHWIHGYCGPYRFLVEWELAHGGQYYPEYCVVLTVLSALFLGLVPMAALFALGWIRTKDPNIPSVVQPDPNSGTIDPLTGIQDLSKGLRVHNQWLRAHKFRLVFLGVGLYLIGSGLWDMVIYTRAGARAQIDAADIHAGSRLPSRWLCIRGHALPEKMVGFEQPSGHLDEAYVPLVSRDWKDGQPVDCFLLKPEILPGPNHEGYEGIVLSSKLSAQFEDGFRKVGIEPAPGAVLIEWGQTPNDLLWRGIFFTIFGIIILGVVLVIWKIKKYHR